MNNIKKYFVIVSTSILISIFFVGIQLHSMKSPKSLRMHQPTQQRQHKTEIIWVKTSDNQLMGIPQWQIDQSKVLQVFFVHQKDSNSKDNPINASMITSKQLVLLQEALQKASNLKIFKEFYISLSGTEQKSLLADAFTLGMQGLASLLITYMFPVEVQQQMGASMLQPTGIIAPVITYLQNPIIITPEKTGEWPFCEALSPNGESILFLHKHYEPHILWNRKTNKKITLPGSEEMRDARFSVDGKYLIITTEGYPKDSVVSKQSNKVILYNATTGEIIKTLQIKGKALRMSTCSLDGNYIFVTSFSDCYVYDIKTNNLITTIDTGTRIRSIACNPVNNDILIGNDGMFHNMRLYDGKTYAWKKSYNSLDTIGSVCVAFSPDGEHIIAGANKLTLWDAKSGQGILGIGARFKTLEGHNEPVHCVTYSPDGNYIASGSQHYIILWNGKTGELLKRFNVVSQHEKCCITFTHNNNSILCGGTDCLVELLLIDPQTLNFIATKLNIAQARFLYRLYLTKINNIPVILDPQDLDYQLFKTLPEDVQHIIKTFLPFELSSDFIEKQIQEKMNEYRSKFKKMTATTDDKIKTLKILMKDLEKDSVDYKACEQLLNELELEAAFEV